MIAEGKGVNLEVATDSKLSDLAGDVNISSRSALAETPLIVEDRPRKVDLKPKVYFQCGGHKDALFHRRLLRLKHQQLLVSNI